MCARWCERFSCGLVGASGLVAFPSAYLDAVALNTALAGMARQGRFARLLFYLEACESGSMFEEVLAADIGVLAVTAANSTSPSFAAFYDERWGGGRAEVGNSYFLNHGRQCFCSMLEATMKL